MIAPQFVAKMVPATIAAQLDVPQLVAAATDSTQQDDALWSVYLLELAARCCDPAVAQQINDSKVALSLLALDLRGRKKKLLVARWQALTAIAQCEQATASLFTLDSSSNNHDSPVLTSAAGLRAVLQLAHDERFGAKDVVAALAHCVVALARLSVVVAHIDLLAVTLDDTDNSDSFSFLALFKQLYVTLPDTALRPSLVDALCAVITTKTHVKAAIGAGLLRTVLQVALDARDADDAPMQHCALLLAHVATIVCLASSLSLSPPSLLLLPSLASPIDTCDNNKRFVCERVVSLLLSNVSIVWCDGVRLLQMLLECARRDAFESSLVRVVDLRGALEKTHALATATTLRLRTTTSKAIDASIVALTTQQVALLTPQIDAFERTSGTSVVGLPPDTEDTSSLDAALALAAACKQRGNWFYRRGNAATARTFYRRAIAILRTTQATHEQTLAAYTPAQVLQHVSAGATVHVVATQSRTWRRAIVTDVDDGFIDVLYDAVDGADDDEDDEEEERIAPTRVRLSLPTRMLAAFDALEADCAMNMGKALVQLLDERNAIECFSHALDALRRNGAGELQTAAALYHRGVAYVAVRDLRHAQVDLRNAHDGAARAHRTSDSKTLLAQIATAYKRLQTLHTNKKRTDKKLIKQIVNYLATIPPLQDE